MLQFTKQPFYLLLYIFLAFNTLEASAQSVPQKVKQQQKKPPQKELDEKAERLKKYICTQPDPKKVEAAKAAEEKFKNKN